MRQRTNTPSQSGPALTCHNNPAKRHRRDDHNEQASSMICHVRPRQLYADGEEAGGEHDTHDLQGDCIGVVAPRPRVERIGAVGADDNAERRSKHDLVDVQLEPDEGFRPLSTL